MPIYVFKSQTGQTLELPFPMGQCPKEVDMDGVTYKRVYTAPSLHVQSPPKKPDSQKILDEVEHTAHDLGMRHLVPLKHQPPKQQLLDLKQNASKFKDDMQKANEESKNRLKQKNTPPPKPTEKQIQQKLQK